MNHSPLIVINNLFKDFGPHRVLDIPALNLECGQVYALTGHNGSGKTTLLRILAGLEKPSGGSVQLGIEKNQIGFCFQKPYMFRGTVIKNVGWAQAGSDTESIHSIAKELQIDGLLNRSAKNLSSGEIQKVSLARMLVCRPRLLLLDEPTAHLDTQGISLVEKTACRFVGEGGTCIVATHIPGHASRLSAQVIRLEGGKIVP